YSDDTCQFLEGVVSKLGLKGSSLKGRLIWKTLQNSDLEKIDNSEETGKGSIQVKRIKKKRVKGKGKNKKYSEVVKNSADNKYEIVPGEGLVAIKDEGQEEEQPDEIRPI